jgi:hypothetical protein
MRFTTSPPPSGTTPNSTPAALATSVILSSAAWISSWRSAATPGATIGMIQTGPGHR